MKRLILLISSLIYLSTAIGVNLHFHYCMGELANWGFGYNKDEKCGKCGMDKKATEDSGCCKDELKHVKLKVDQKSLNTVVYQFHIAESESFQAITQSPTHLESPQPYSLFLIADPPRSSCIATYIRNCNFRI